MSKVKGNYKECLDATKTRHVLDNQKKTVDMCDAPVGSSGEGVAVLCPALIAVTQGTWVWCPAAT